MASNDKRQQRRRQIKFWMTTHHLCMYMQYMESLWFNGISLNGHNFTISEQIVILCCTNVSRDLFQVVSSFCSGDFLFGSVVKCQFFRVYSKEKVNRIGVYFFGVVCVCMRVWFLWVHFFWINQTKWVTSFQKLLSIPFSYWFKKKYIERNQVDKKLFDEKIKMVNQGAETIDAFEHFSTAHFIPPKQSFREFLYNKKAKTVLGRNGESWSKYSWIIKKIENLKYTKWSYNLVWVEWGRNNISDEKILCAIAILRSSRKNEIISISLVMLLLCSRCKPHCEWFNWKSQST